ncbi:MAG: pseudouridine synthase [Candidatus Dadabacteria bacterium]|nr:pseudouridine synthase [Candidatus Dadabacteria bacterium]
MRLNRFLSECGVTSRRKADNLIKAGRVTVNGEVVCTLGSVIDESADAVALDGKPLRKETKRYVMLNKPPFYLTSLKSLEDGKKTITSFLGDIEQRVYPVGRLDYDSEGLLLLTNDGELANRIHHPRYKVVKTYFAQVSGDVSENLETVLQDGADIEKRFVIPDSVNVLRVSERRARVSISFHEGQKHLVKKYFEVFGLRVTRLKRISCGNISLGKLEKGAWRDLSPAELKGLRRITGLVPRDQ